MISISPRDMLTVNRPYRHEVRTLYYTSQDKAQRFTYSHTLVISTREDRDITFTRQADQYPPMSALTNQPWRGLCEGCAE